MPNPMRYKGSDLNIDPRRAFSKPGFAEKIALIAALWQRVESRFGYAFAMMLRGQEGAAIEIYASLIDRNLRKQVFLVTAKNRLSDELVTEAATLFDAARRLSTRRNDVVHAVWTTLERRPESILLVSPKDEIRLIHKLTLDDKPDFEFSLIEYTLKDMDSIIHDIDEFNRLGEGYMWRVARFVSRRASKPGPPQDAPLPQKETSTFEAPQTTQASQPLQPPKDRPS